MRKYLSAAVAASVLLATSGAALAQNAPPAPAATQEQAAAQLAAQINAAIAALGANPTPEAVRAAVINAIVASGQPPATVTVALSAVSAQQANSPAAVQTAVQSVVQSYTAAVSIAAGAAGASGGASTGAPSAGGGGGGSNYK